MSRRCPRRLCGGHGGLVHVLNFSHSECKTSNTEAALVGKRDINQVFVLTTQGILHKKIQVIWCIGCYIQNFMWMGQQLDEIFEAAERGGGGRCVGSFLFFFFWRALY